jgi:mevalonate kinase
MKRKQEIFYGKVLLFGEYSILLNSMGLTTPFTHFTGELSFLNEDKYTDYNLATGSNKILREYAGWLGNHDKSSILTNILDLDLLHTDLSKGLYFESNIPQGYGIGSSGALVAALYQRYAFDRILSTSRISKDQTKHLLAVFSAMEAYFHGTSSGIDPLNCYLHNSLLIKPGKDISVTSIPRNKFYKEGAVFLIDTGVVGKTGPLVSQFLKKMKDKAYENLIQKTYIPMVNNCINHILSSDLAEFGKELVNLSRFQLSHFEEMIPVSFRNLWEQGLDENLFQVKLCGSGGGGFLLGFTSDFNKTLKFFEQRKIAVFPVSRTVDLNQ